VKEFRVYDVYNNSVRSGRTPRTRFVNRPLAYLTFQGAGFCPHVVRAASGPEAKRIATQEHRRSPTCRQEDWKAVEP